VLTVAGGQGTRLGFDRPKGLFPIGPVTERTLFRLIAERIEAAERRYGAPVRWLVMTSPATHDDTVAYFRSEGDFGREPDRLRFLVQGTNPAVDFDGKLLLEDRGRIVASPNGHGGSLLALYESGTTRWLAERSVHTIYYHQVDNPLVPVPDPVFLGHHAQAGAQMSTKVVAKASPEEKVGVLCEIDGRTCVIEYSDLDEARMHERDERGRLRFRGGNIAVHAIEASFVEQLTKHGLELPVHIARKKVPHIDESGREVRPDEPNGFKFETFVFDALPLASRTLTQEVAREEEFAPVKNAEGVDSPETSRRALSGLYTRWLAEAGVEDARRALAAGEPRAVEISPLLALDAAELVSRIGSPAGIEYLEGLVLGPRRD